MFEFHKDRKRYFDMQVENTIAYVLPFLEQTKKMKPGMRVLEIGCGEGGVLKPFIDKGCITVGVEFDEIRLENANEWMAEEVADGKALFIPKDIYLTSPEELGGKFDLIILKDVIEHIFDQPKLFKRMKEMLLPEGVIFFGFPPWQMPFGGHQQVMQHKLLSKVPYTHLLPKPLYRQLIKMGGMDPAEFLEIYDTRISIERFERITAETGYQIQNRLLYFINPIYKYKFNLRGRKQAKIIANIPWFRNFFTTCAYYTIAIKG
ncbi:class I SAM-dependent methyltransferase [Taibaiella sp. KBW10]|uniref:class I SAM-dependent methyltransferase n=1 Tax=Taibaiella sp. KBW10 TaxID=2153357 RepID=UPI000F5B33D4|nr:class I SAM-dependent methyltransferase [Taibaiella sp. KBW10]RQO31679.1 class I SAM-dependent methyltransferase [Taibaiella sp. KBW10]